MLIASILAAAVCLALGVLFSLGKGAFLIAGYNTASETEKRTIDEKKLCKLTGRLMFVLAGCMLFPICGVLFHVPALYGVGFVLFAAVAVGGVIFMNTGNRIKKSDAGAPKRAVKSDLAAAVQRAEEEYRKNHPENGG